MTPCTIPFSIPFTIHNGYASVPLCQEQCASLARACWFASQEGLDPHLDHWRTLAALFDTLLYRWQVRALAWPLSPRLLLAERAYVRPIFPHKPHHADGSGDHDPHHPHYRQPPEFFSLDLSARQCAHLARACWFAIQNSPEREMAYWLPLATTFQACAVAGLAQWQMDAAELEALADDLAELGLVETGADGNYSA